MAHNQDIQLATAMRTLLSRLIKKLRKESETASKLSLTERSTMGLLQQYKQLLPSELASMEKITNQSMSSVLNNLSSLGYITRTASETDGRKVYISLSTLGNQVMTQWRSERDEWLAKAIRETCTQEEQEWLWRSLIPLKKLVDFD
jgi:DNA-binding MarR family transcriptional regulator